MIRRVTVPTSAAGPTAMSVHGLPPGTPVNGPMQLVYIEPSLTWFQTVPADALITSDGAPVYATGPTTWDQVHQAGRAG